MLAFIFAITFVAWCGRNAERRLNRLSLVCKSLADELFEQRIIFFVVPVVYDLHADDDGWNILGSILLDDAVPIF